MDFPKLKARCHLLPRGKEGPLNDDELTTLICSDCPFYKEGQDEELECGAFNLLRHLLDKKVVTLDDILSSIRE